MNILVVVMVVIMVMVVSSSGDGDMHVDNQNKDFWGLTLDFIQIESKGLCLGHVFQGGRTRAICGWSGHNWSHGNANFCIREFICLVDWW